MFGNLLDDASGYDYLALRPARGRRPRDTQLVLRERADGGACADGPVAAPAVLPARGQ